MSPEGNKTSISNGQLHTSHAPKLVNRPSAGANTGSFFKLTREDKRKLNNFTMPLHSSNGKKNAYATANIHLSDKILQNKYGKFTFKPDSTSLLISQRSSFKTILYHLSHTSILFWLMKEIKSASKEKDNINWASIKFFNQLKEREENDKEQRAYMKG